MLIFIVNFYCYFSSNIRSRHPIHVGFIQPKRVKSLNSVIFVSHPYIFKKKSSFSAL